MNDEITIIRAKHSKENPYYLGSRKTAQNSNLTWESRGVIAYLISKPDNWQIRISDLQQGCGQQKVYKILRELKKAGYLTGRVRQKQSDGKFVWTPYEFHEAPCDGKPCDGKPYMVNHHILDNREEQSTEKSTPPDKSGDASATSSNSKTDTKEKKDVAPDTSPADPDETPAPVAKSERKQMLDDLWNAMCEVWPKQAAAAGVLGVRRRFLLGEAKKKDGKWFEHQAQFGEKPVTAAELKAFAHWWTTARDDLKTNPDLVLPMSADTLEKRFAEFRARATVSNKPAWQTEAEQNAAGIEWGYDTTVTEFNHVDD